MKNCFLYIVIITLVWSCSQEGESFETLPRSATKVEVAKDVEILYSDSAVVRIRIKGPTLVNHTTPGNQKREFPNGIIVDFFDSEQRTTSRMTAKYAIQLSNQRKVLIQDSVVVKGVEETMETEGLVWDENKQLITSDRYVRITTNDEVITGYGFESDQEFTNWEIKKVTGRFKVEGDEFN